MFLIKHRLDDEFDYGFFFVAVSPPGRMLPDQPMLSRQTVRSWHLETTGEYPGQSNSDDADVQPGADTGDARNSDPHCISRAISRGNWGRADCRQKEWLYMFLFAAAVSSRHSVRQTSQLHVRV